MRTARWVGVLSELGLGLERSRRFSVRGGERQNRSTVAAAPLRAAPRRNDTTGVDLGWAWVGLKSRETGMGSPLCDLNRIPLLQLLETPAAAVVVVG